VKFDRSQQSFYFILFFSKEGGGGVGLFVFDNNNNNNNKNPATPNTKKDKQTNKPRITKLISHLRVEKRLSRPPRFIQILPKLLQSFFSSEALEK